MRSPKQFPQGREFGQMNCTVYKCFRYPRQVVAPLPAFCSLCVFGPFRGRMKQRCGKTKRTRAITKPIYQNPKQPMHPLASPVFSLFLEESFCQFMIQFRWTWYWQSGKFCVTASLFLCVSLLTLPLPCLFRIFPYRIQPRVSLFNVLMDVCPQQQNYPRPFLDMSESCPFRKAVPAAQGAVLHPSPEQSSNHARFLCHPLAKAVAECAVAHKNKREQQV